MFSRGVSRFVGDLFLRTVTHLVKSCPPGCRRCFFLGRPAPEVHTPSHLVKTRVRRCTPRAHLVKTRVRRCTPRQNTRLKHISHHTEAKTLVLSVFCFRAVRNVLQTSVFTRCVTLRGGPVLRTVTHLVKSAPPGCRRTICSGPAGS